MTTPMPADPALQARAFAHAGAQLTADEKQEARKRAAERFVEKLEVKHKLLVNHAYHLFRERDTKGEWAAFVQQTEPRDIDILLNNAFWDGYWKADKEQRQEIPVVSLIWALHLRNGRVIFEEWRKRFRQAYARNMRKLGIEVEIGERAL